MSQGVATGHGVGAAGARWSSACITRLGPAESSEPPGRPGPGGVAEGVGGGGGVVVEAAGPARLVAASRDGIRSVTRRSRAVADAVRVERTKIQRRVAVVPPRDRVEARSPRRCATGFTPPGVGPGEARRATAEPVSAAVDRGPRLNPGMSSGSRTVGVRSARIAAGALPIDPSRSPSPRPDEAVRSSGSIDARPDSSGRTTAAWASRTTSSSVRIGRCGTAGSRVGSRTSPASVVRALDR